MSLKSLLRAAALASATLALAGPALAATQWTMASGYPETSFFTKNIRQFIAAVEERTKGELKIDLRSHDSLIKLDNIKRAVQSGQVQIGEIRMGVYGNEQEMFNLDNIPGVVPTFDKSWKLMEAQKPFYDEWFGRNGMRVITYVAWPGQGFFTAEPINSLDDLKGVKLRIYSQQTQVMGEKLGTQAIILPFAEVPQAFATGMIEALWTSAQSGTDVQVWDYLDVFTYTGTMHNKNAVIVNERALRALPEDIRAIVLEEGEAATARGWELAKAASEERENVLKEHGITINQAPQDVLDRIDEIGKEMVADWMTRASDAEKAVYEAYQASLD
ncbi:TRAP transporter substrate-binding protein [Stappia indica]|uniref:TRAP-type C4-dicarboxylate transport system, substrate-binding protein n=1 Tax=Stappia indica TaxID=538381 RepID=A0A285SW69_9HYPH|nr:TRAP transporter substrate-binding protein [Stappia indica]SOC12846.1 TRAP-type C4-dicarboxylate transport system, substrate-binding protein [Stappia indica]